MMMVWVGRHLHVHVRGEGEAQPAAVVVVVVVVVHGLHLLLPLVNRTQGEAAQSLDGTWCNHSTIVAARH